MDLGLNNTIVRFVAKYRVNYDSEGEKQFLGSVFIIYIVISLIIVFLGIMLYHNLDEIFFNSLTSEEIRKGKFMFQILILNIAIVLPGGAFTAICNAYESFVWPRLVSIVKYISRALLIFVLLTKGGGAITLVVIDTVLNALLILVISIFVIKKLKVSISFKSIKLELFKKIFNYSIWIFLLAITSGFLWQAGQIILGITTDTETVAYYAVGIVLGNYYASFSGAISSVFLPRATQMSIKSTKSEILEMMIKIGRISLQILLFILTGFFLFGREFIYWWVGDNYHSSYDIALVIMIAYTLPLILNFANSLVEAYDKVKFKVLVYLIFFSAGLSLGYILIPSLKEIGMVLGLGIGWMISQIIMIIFYHKYLELNMYSFFRQTFAKIIFPVVLLSILTYTINFYLSESFISFVVKILAYSISYWALLYLFSMNEYEKNILKRKKT
jgi:O-antigen/teichoic acid export membrane protein